VVDAGTDQDLVDAVRSADAADEPVLVVGGGSNLLVADEGFPGTVVRVGTRGVDVDRSVAGTVRVRVAAGEPWDDLVALAVAEGWSGLEALSGIPGSTGATPIQNVGAYGAEVASVVRSVEVLDRANGERRVMLPADLALGYRTSVLKRIPDRWLVLAVTFRLGLDPMSAPVRYAELAGRLSVAPEECVPLADVRSAVLSLRRAKGMVLDAADHDTWSAGSFFTNPILAPVVAAELPAGAPRFPLPDGSVKASAAWLISNAGFPRGFGLRPGAPASLSTKHSLAITNRGGATAADLLELARTVRAGVAERFGILLENEPVLVGCAL
jgi:UDP-N-acetylmuramate dehydrogenase